MRITVNGKPMDVQPRAMLLDVRDLVAPEADVVIRNGYQTDLDVPLKEGDSVTYIRKGTYPDPHELEHMLAARHTPGVHNKVKNACIGVAGLGGLGSNIAVLLARTGVGKLVLVDFDTVEPSNLNRQCYDIRHLGLYKTEAMARQLADINPYVEVAAHCMRVDASNAAELFRGCSVVCEAFDRPDAKAELAEAVLGGLPDTWLVAASGMAGYDSANTIRTQRAMSRLYVCGDTTSEAREGCGLMAPRVAVCAAHQANMALRLVLGETDC